MPLVFWYTHQQFFVQMGSSVSEDFGASNMTRQGGILSPHLFNIYVDGFSQLLNNVKCSCIINEVSINHLIYADDTVLIAPSTRGLQQLILLCEQYANKTDIMFNVKNISIYVHKAEG